MYRSALLIITVTVCAGCLPPLEDTQNQTSSELDDQLRALIIEHNLDQSPTDGLVIPDVDDSIVQLGKKLFFSKSLSGDLNVACASCHHPLLGGGDALAVSIGVNAIEPDTLGPNRIALNRELTIGRNAPTVFNTALWRDGLFWDSRVERIGRGGIATPDSGHRVRDPDAGATLAAAQAKFPVTSIDEMLGASFAIGEANTEVRDHLAQRIGGYGNYPDTFLVNDWLEAFQQAFDVDQSAEALVTFENIAFAIGEYERSMLFIDSPWQAYVNGDNAALDTTQKEGAILFLTDRNQGGANCVRCHSGTAFTNERFERAAFAQFGPTTLQAGGDTGRGSISGEADHQYAFRTSMLLNIEVTAPYGHAGTYETLFDVMDHYDDPEDKTRELFDSMGMCQIPPYDQLFDCANNYEFAESASERAIGNTNDLPNIQINNSEKAALVAFLESLTDPCVKDETCLAPWLPDEQTDDPDTQLLKASF